MWPCILSIDYSLFKDLPSLLPPFSLQFSIISAILLQSILVTWRSQFDFVSSWFLVSWFYFQLLQNVSTPFIVNKRVHSAVLMKNYISIDVSLFYPFVQRFKSRFHTTECRQTVHYIFLYSWQRLDQNLFILLLKKSTLFGQILLVPLCWITFFIFLGNFPTEVFKNSLVFANISYP